MKTFLRVVIILVAALLVSGATFAFGQSSQASAIINSLSGRSGFEQRGAGRQPPANFEGRRGGEGGGEMGGFTIAGVGPVLKNAGICIVLIAVSLGWRALRRGSRKPKAEPLAL